MTGTPHDLDGLDLPSVAPERHSRRQELALEMLKALLKVGHEKGPVELEDTVWGAMIGIAESLAQVDGGNAFFAEICNHFGNNARTLRDQPPTSRVLQ